MTNYLKENKWKVLISTLATLIPAIVGLILWDKLPDPMPVHWNALGEVDGWAPKAFAVLGMPSVLAVLNIVCHVANGADKRNAEQSEKVVSLIFWLVPTIANVVCVLMYVTAMGSEVSAIKIAVVLVGVITVLIGNYMPKCKPNYTIGVKLVWTLKSNANWVTTHRLVGKVWLAGGILLILCALLPMPTLLYVALGLFLIMTIVPVAYSYLYYRRHKDDEGYFTVKSAGESEK